MIKYLCHLFTFCLLTKVFPFYLGKIILYITSQFCKDYSKCSLWTSRIGITKEHVRNGESQAPLRPRKSESAF